MERQRWPTKTQCQLDRVGGVQEDEEEESLELDGTTESQHTK